MSFLSNRTDVKPALGERLTRRRCVALLALSPLSSVAAGPDTTEAPARPDHWAEPLHLPGVRNLHRVHAGLYRSEQPTARGMSELYRLGVRTVINLRAFHSDDDEIAGTGLLNTRLRVNTWDVEDEHVIAVLRVLRQADKGPFLIHCLHGADRTGLMSAMYRIVEQGWSKEHAIEEMTRGGYGWHSIWRNIPRYIKRTDVVALRRSLGEAQPVA